MTQSSNAQKTIKKAIKVEGLGLHTGEKVVICFLPAAENFGFKFQRIDLEGQPIIDVNVDNVTDTSRGTTLSKNGASVSTVEHVLAALVGMDLDNVLIQSNAQEMPILDGSSILFVKAIQKVGIKEQKEERKYYTITENIEFKDTKNNIELVVIPSDEYKLTCMIDFNSPTLGTQHSSISSLKEFKNQIASCRTFCFLHELEMLLERDLIKGGDLNNAIVVVDKKLNDKKLKKLAQRFNRENIQVAHQGILNNIELRYPNEPARHKLLDIVGDLTLLGQRIKGHVFASRPGHKANVSFAKVIKKHIKKEQKLINSIPVYDTNVKPVYDTSDIIRMLPHDPPFLLVDKIIEISDKHIVGVKNVTIGDFFFEGHFKDYPVMPGVMQIEALAQNGGLLVLHNQPNPEDYLTFFLKVKECKFKEKVFPGDTLILRCELIEPIRRGLVLMKCLAMVNKEIVCQAELMAQVTKNI